MRGQGLLTVEASRSHSDTPHSVGLLWTSDQPDAETSELYLTAHDTHKRQTSVSPLGFEPTNPSSVRPQTHTLDRAVTGSGKVNIILSIKLSSNK
jgi:hypothetical protein